MRFIYEKGDKVVVLATGEHEVVSDITAGFSDVHIITESGNAFSPQQIRPALDTAVLVAEMGGVRHVFLGLPNTFLQDPDDGELANLATHYNQAYHPDDEANYEVVWCQTADDVKRAIKAANGDDDADDAISCDECEQDMVILEDGVSHHLDEDGNVDHDADADHVARNKEHDEPNGR